MRPVASIVLGVSGGGCPPRAGGGGGLRRAPPPATADLLARAAAGRADDLLTATLLTATCPVVFVPAMHTEMWLNPATQDNVATLRRRGAVVLPPAVGRLTGPDSGPGRLPEPADIAALALVVLEHGAAALAGDLTGRRVVIS